MTARFPLANTRKELSNMADFLVFRAKDDDSSPKTPSSLSALYTERSRPANSGLLRRISTLAKDVTSKVFPLGLAPTAAERKAASLYFERKLILETRMGEVR